MSYISNFKNLSGISRNWWMLPTSSLTPKQQTYISSAPPTIFQYNPDKAPYLGVSENSGFYPQIIPSRNRVFHYFHHPFWSIPIFGNTHLTPGGVNPPTSQCCFWALKPWIPGGITSQCLVQQVDHTTFLKDLNQVASLEVSLP